MITIVDYGMGNIGSIVNMLKKLGASSRLSQDPAEILGAERLILPGVGAFGRGMENLRSRGLVEVLNEAVIGARKPTLGICLGMQLLGEGSEEAGEAGLGWIGGRNVRFRFEREPLRVPHMGWNVVQPKTAAALFSAFDGETRFYFVHSYHFVSSDPADVAATSVYGFEFTAALQRGNLFGVQFHPEKSHKFGERLLQRFVEYPAC